MQMSINGIIANKLTSKFNNSDYCVCFIYPLTYHIN